MQNNRKQIINYIIFGILTTLVNILSYSLFTQALQFDYKVATTFSWILSVLFAFVTNKLYVFESRDKDPKSVFRELFSFFFFRLLSYIIDLVSMIILISFLQANDLLSKIIANIIVVIFNYFASKYIIFKKENVKEKLGFQK